MPRSQITVVVPVLNEVVQLANLICSLRGLGLSAVFVDGGSTDGSVALMERALAGRDDMWLVQSKAGRGRQLQAGLDRVRTDVVVFLHADCRLPVDACSQMAAALQRPDVAGGAFGTRHVGRFRDRLWLSVSDCFSLTRKDAYGDQAIFARTEVLRARGGVPALPLFEDIELSRRLQPSVRCPGPVLVSARRHARAPIRSLIIVNLFPTLYDWGVEAATLSRWYKTMHTS